MQGLVGPIERKDPIHWEDMKSLLGQCENNLGQDKRTLENNLIRKHFRMECSKRSRKRVVM